MSSIGHIMIALVLSLVLVTCVNADFTFDSDMIDTDNTRVKRQSVEVKVSEYLALIELLRNYNNGCAEPGCGVVDIRNRVKRSSSDQRIAELQALMALMQSGGLVAHGQFDPTMIGKRKRSFQPPIETAADERRWELVKALVRKEASLAGEQ